MSEEKQKKMALIASKGSLDMAYPPLILASTAAAMDVETMIFFTFYGVDIINKHKYANLKVAPIANH
jgi:peroxiredoxin family protein